MTTFTLDQLITELTEEEVLEQWLDALETIKVPARSWRQGGALRTILRVVASSYAGFTNIQAAFIKSGFLDYAEEGWLTALAKYVYGVDREPASFASGTFLLSNNGGGDFTQDVGTVRVLHATTRKAYTNTEAFVLTSGTQNLEVDFTATEEGPDSSAGANEITVFETFLPECTVTNPSAIVGLNEQSDPELRVVCRAKLATLSPNGPRGAYAFAVLTAKRNDGTPVDINRVWISPSSSTGVVTIYAASPSGTPTSEDLDAAEANIERLARTDTDTLDLHGATAVPLSKSLVLWAQATEGLSSDLVEDSATTALANYTATYPIGGIAKPPSTQGYLYASAVEGTAKSAHESIFAVDGVGGDLALNPGEVPILTADLEVRFVDVGGFSS